MKISEHLYKSSGVEYATNSNTFLLKTKEELILFDLGFDDKQWKAMEYTKELWG